MGSISLRRSRQHELLEPAGRGDHDEQERVGIERHGGEVEHDAGPSHRRGTVERPSNMPRRERASSLSRA